MANGSESLPRASSSSPVVVPPPRLAPSSSQYTRGFVGERVTLNVYEFARFLDSPSLRALDKLGLGVYHSGLEVRGVEHTFTVQGIVATPPKIAHQCRWKLEVVVGYTLKTGAEVDAIIAALGRADPAGAFAVGRYSSARRNCNHFTDALARALTGRAIPGWVNRVAGLSAVLGISGPESMQSESDQRA